jgi:hypothetical protein
LAQQRDKDNFRSQVEDRLDHLFQEESPEATEEHVGLGEHPLKGLKAVLLSIDWEITDSTMDSLLNEIKNVEYVYSEDKIILTFLQLLGSIGRYVKANKGRAHPDATRVINSVYEALEKVALTEGMTRAEKEKMLLEEVAKFKKLKEQVVLRKVEKREPSVSDVTPPSTAFPAPAPEEKESPVTESPAREEAQVETRSEARFAEMSPHEAFAYALEEIKDVIRAEFRALRAEIRLWRESK